MADLLEVIARLRAYNVELQLRIFLTRIDARTKEAIEMLAFLNKQQRPVLRAVLANGWPNNKSSQQCRKVSIQVTICLYDFE